MAGSLVTGSIQLWRLGGPSGATTFPGHSGDVLGLALLPDGQTLISSAGDIRFWDIRTRQETDKLNPSAGGGRGLAVSPDGRRFAVGASDERITIWDVASRQEVATLKGHKEEVRDLAFTPDGDHLVAVSKDQREQSSGQTTVPVAAQRRMRAIAAGDIHTVALRDDGTVVAWGANYDGQTTEPVAAQSGVKAIAAGYSQIRRRSSVPDSRSRTPFPASPSFIG